MLDGITDHRHFLCVRYYITYVHSFSPYFHLTRNFFNRSKVPVHPVITKGKISQYTTEKSSLLPAFSEERNSWKNRYPSEREDTSTMIMKYKIIAMPAAA